MTVATDTSYTTAWDSTRRVTNVFVPGGKVQWWQI